MVSLDSLVDFLNQPIKSTVVQFFTNGISIVRRGHGTVPTSDEGSTHLQRENDTKRHKNISCMYNGTAWYVVLTSFNSVMVNALSNHSGETMPKRSLAIFNFFLLSSLSTPLPSPPRVSSTDLKLTLPKCSTDDTTVQRL